MKQVSNWEERFDEEYAWLRGVARADDANHELTLKNFIRAEIESAEQWGRDMAVEYIGAHSSRGSIERKVWNNAAGALEWIDEVTHQIFDTDLEAARSPEKESNL